MIKYTYLLNFELRVGDSAPLKSCLKYFKNNWFIKLTFNIETLPRHFPVLKTKWIQPQSNRVRIKILQIEIFKPFNFHGSINNVYIRRKCFLIFTVSTKLLRWMANQVVAYMQHDFGIENYIYNQLLISIKLFSKKVFIFLIIF